MTVIEVTETQTAVRSVLQKFKTVRSQSDALFQVVHPDVLYDRPIDARHRVIFYIGHLDGFDSILICREALGLDSSDVEFDRLFQAGIDPDSNHLPADTPEDWPDLERVRAYVDRCRQHVDDHVAKAPQHVIDMALEHRLMHLETLAYMFHNFAYEKKPIPAEPHEVITNGHAPNNEWISIPSGEATLGKMREEGFGWDNEFARSRIFVPSFRIQKRSVSNGEYLAFVKDGGPSPHFWVTRNGATYWRGMFGEIPLPLDWPVYVTQQQASAYADWLGGSLPSETQFHRAAYACNSEEREYPWGSEPPERVPGNFNFRRWDPEPVWSSPGDSAFGVSQLVGNGWQWTNTVFAPFPGFAADPFYRGYSANFFDGQHYVMKGGSPRTAASMLRRSFRNWFRPDYPYTYATFRCVKGD